MLLADMSKQEIGIKILRWLHDFTGDLPHRKRFDRAELNQFFDTYWIHLAIQPIHRSQFAFHFNTMPRQSLFEEPDEQSSGIVDGYIVAVGWIFQRHLTRNVNAIFFQRPVEAYGSTRGIRHRFGPVAECDVSRGSGERKCAEFTGFGTGSNRNLQRVI